MIDLIRSVSLVVDLDTFRCHKSKAVCRWFTQIHITEKGIVQGFNVIEQDGQKGEFIFSNVDLGKPAADRFTFVAPEGVEVDDQRN